MARRRLVLACLALVTLATSGCQQSDPDALTCRKTIHVGMQGPGCPVAFSPDGTWLAWGDLGTVHLRKERSRPITLRPDGWVQDVAFSPDGATLAIYDRHAGRGEKVIRLWDVATQTEIGVLEAGRASLESRCLVFSPDGTLLAGPGAESFTVCLWDVATRLPRAVIGKTSHAVKAIAFSPDGKSLAVANHDGLTQMWDVATGQNTFALGGHTRTVFAASFSPDGRQLATGGADGTAIIWDIVTRAPVVTIPATGEVRAVAFSPDGRWLAIGSTAGDSLRLWDVAAGRVKTQVAVHYRVNTVAFSPDSKSLATSGYDGDVKLWDVPR